jgi:hypothetical protein
MWEPRYDREGLPFTDDEWSVLTPRGELEADRRFLMGALWGSRRQRRAAVQFAVLVGGLIALMGLVAVILAIL